MEVAEFAETHLVIARLDPSGKIRVIGHIDAGTAETSQSVGVIVLPINTTSCLFETRDDLWRVGKWLWTAGGIAMRCRGLIH